MLRHYKISHNCLIVGYKQNTVTNVRNFLTELDCLK